MASSDFFKSLRESRLYDSTMRLKQLKVPLHVENWVTENYDELDDLYSLVMKHTEQCPWILDQSDFVSFCACIARLSAIDSPHSQIGRTGGRSLMFDIGAGCSGDNRVNSINKEIAVLNPELLKPPLLKETHDDSDEVENEVDFL